jgi:molybdate transport system ATP-binding protein
MISAPLIGIRNVDLAFSDDLALGKLSFDIGRGRIICVAGPSGGGRTTAVRVAAGLIAPTGARSRSPARWSFASGAQAAAKRSAWRSSPIKTISAAAPTRSKTPSRPKSGP